MNFQNNICVACSGIQLLEQDEVLLNYSKELCAQDVAIAERSMELETAEKEMRDLRLVVREEKRQIGLRKKKVLEEKWLEGEIATLQIEVGGTQTHIFVDAQIKFGVYLHIVALINIKISFCSERTNSIKGHKHLDETRLCSHRKSHEATKTRTQCSFSASGSRDWACICTESQRLVLTLCWTRRLAAEPLSVLDECRAGTAIAMCFFDCKTKDTLFSFFHLFTRCVAMYYFLFYCDIKSFHLFVILLICSVVSLFLWLPFFFQKPPPKQASLINFIAVCSCCLGNLSSKLP